MSAIHREWLGSQTAPALHTCDELGVCNSRPGCTCGASPSPLITRRFARTTDEAFRTPLWRNPVQGPYHRSGGARRRLHAALGWALLVLAGLLLVGAAL